MADYLFQRVEPNSFATYYSIYDQENLCYIHDWSEQLAQAERATQHFFIHNGESVIGGFTLHDNCISHPFLSPIFHNRELFWTLIMDYMQDLGYMQILWKGIYEADLAILTDKYNATVTLSQKRMLRPTGETTPVLDRAYYFSDITPKDIESIIQTIFEAHSAGYTATFRTPNMDEIRTAVGKRLEAFAQTDSLHLSNLVKTRLDDRIIGVCLAGIYPDSANHFSTVHQLSIHPNYQKRGIGKAMLLRTIAQAVDLSPVITLGVMEGNLAENLYAGLGFKAGPTYHDLSIDY